MGTMGTPESHTSMHQQQSNCFQPTVSNLAVLQYQRCSILHSMLPPAAVHMTLTAVKSAHKAASPVTLQHALHTAL